MGRRSTGKSVGPTEFDEMLGNDDVYICYPLDSSLNGTDSTNGVPHTITDAPCAKIADELLAAYPKAKVILTI